MHRYHYSVLFKLFGEHLKSVCPFVCLLIVALSRSDTILYFQLHTSELNDGYDWGRLNLQSVTEQSSMDDFLATAELAGTEFIAGNN